MRVGSERRQLGARHHHLAGGEIGEAEHTVEHLLFLLLEDARLLAGRDEHLQLLFGVDHRAAVGAVEAERPDDRLRRAVRRRG